MSLKGPLLMVWLLRPTLSMASAISTLWRMTPMEPVTVPGLAMMTSPPAATYRPPEAATEPMEATTGFLRALTAR